ncbi:23S rRNA (pseudouridine(1915)-N(3))-methyltransferase RlmH [bacterium]|nr:23S rRNA (pseudouridine(1915)-N(3))-methyltransferase RlmH [bacterium]
MRITIACVGKMREAAQKSLIDEYLKRCPWAIQVQDVVAKKAQQGEALQREEAELLKLALGKVDRLVILDERGKNPDSIEFAHQLRDWRDGGCQHLGFVIGGAEGVHPELRKQAHLLLSFGKLTWPHMLARILLTEQLYRAWSILEGHPYHKV